jgi:hypothetical protein
VSLGARKLLKSPTNRDRNIRMASSVDTTLLLEELKHKYRDSLSPVEVSFRNLVGWVRPGDQISRY